MTASTRRCKATLLRIYRGRCWKESIMNFGFPSMTTTSTRRSLASSGTSPTTTRMSHSQPTITLGEATTKSERLCASAKLGSKCSRTSRKSASRSSRTPLTSKCTTWFPCCSTERPWSRSRNGLKMLPSIKSMKTSWMRSEQKSLKPEKRSCKWRRARLSQPTGENVSS